LNDRQTIGGYPKIGSVISIDTAKLGQLAQGGRVRFKAITMGTARKLVIKELNLFNQTEVLACE